MKISRSHTHMRFLGGASAIALGFAPQAALAQDAGETDTGTDAEVNEAGADNQDEDAIVISGIRASLRAAMDIKRDAQGVVDAISAEDIGKFPDTNLAESLQRITGVSIDRNSGEGSTVTVRGFGPDFNLVLLNGRQMPASGLGSCCEAPASRSFDFANLASEGVAAVEVYKSGRATLPTGGIGSVINIRTPRPLDRPGFQGSVGAKAVLDTGTFEGTDITPEISGIISKTFADDTVGILLAGSYQQRKAGLAQFNAGWREGYVGFENNWGSLPVDESDWRGNFAQTENRPGPTDIYQVTQNAGYDFTTIDRERINGQAVIQVAATDTLSATVDYTFSQNTIDARTNSIGVWFNHNQTSSSWTDGPTAGPNFYAESFGPGEGKDLAITGAVAANRSINHSIGGNIEWSNYSGLSFELDAHHSTAESKPTSPYGSNIAVGSAIFGVENQRVDFTSEMPVISVNMYPGSEIQASNIRPAGNAFRNAYMKNEINQVALRGAKEFDDGFIDSLDFGVSYTENKVRSAYGFLQTDSWGGTLQADELPDEFYQITGLPGHLAGMEGSNDPSIIQNYFQIDTENLIEFLDDQVGICSMPWVGTPSGTGCLAEFSVDRRTTEKTIAPYVQSTHQFFTDSGKEVNFRFGLRYEQTDVESEALVPVPTGTAWVAGNEIAILYGGESDFTTLEGDYDFWLPAIDFDMEVMRDVVVRASYSHTITRPRYDSLQGGITLASPIRVGGGTAGSGNPGLLPYLSKNVDLSAEWYYGPASYVSVGIFDKEVKNFISSNTIETNWFGLTNPALGPVAQEAIAAVGTTAPFSDIVAYVAANYPNLIDPDTGGILGTSSDPLVNFITTQPTNSNQTANLSGFEFAIQHNFWDSGFGTILNYTIVNSDTFYDNTLRYTIPQFAVTGVSDSANAVLFYDKGPIQARVAYNWRDGFLSGYGLDPFYVEAYGQVDASASYDFGNGITAFVEGINILNADRRGHMRDEQAIFFAAPGYARYAGGVRFTW
ncbi:TonB-dependent receptor [Sphingomicrobium clamense]|uniref:TonB-dependent receptor n=1 Tax=Sphingomicrobium clamense TaxID=2851013 RepID=A0ABS6V2J1_9SPHN|nr:TonB-dependent receptor [Sphingomicrobium sp. B8]MBW0143696.1 TonB-dependent receptor [Sphingomicrobium sp. B8]